MRLNLGSGDDRREGYTNVDLRSDCADVLADVRELPFGSNSASDILALDILEHLPPDDTVSTLRHWYGILEPGGQLTLKVPNLFQLARMIANDHMVEAAIQNIYGGHRWGPDGCWDAHHAGWTPAMMFGILHEVGFVDTTCDLALNMTFTARKPYEGLEIRDVQ